MSVSVLFADELELSPSLESAWLHDLPRARRAQLAGWPERRDRHRSIVASRLLLAPALPAIDTSPGRGRAAFAGRLWRTAPLALGAGHVGHVATAAFDAEAAVEQLAAEALL